MTRSRFGDEMLGIFNTARGTRQQLEFLADGVVSLVRQWTVRSEFRRPVALAAAGSSDVPLFGTLEDDRPSNYKARKSAWMFSLGMPGLTPPPTERMRPSP